MNFEKFAFEGEAGPTKIIYDVLPRPIQPRHVFETFQTEEILKLIRDESELHRLRKGEKSKGKARSRILSAKPIEIADLRIMDSILCTMGIIKLPCISQYWSTRSILKTEFIRKIMSRDRFYDVFHSLHFSSLNSTENNGDKLYKVRELVTKYKNVFKENYIPEENISIDESLELWKGGRVAFKVYIPRKKCKNGFQQFRLCEARSGYCYDFEYFSSNEKEVYERDEIHGIDVSDFTTPAKVVLHLLEPLLNLGYTVGVDNLYTDPRLFEFLLKHKTNAVGTFRSTRKYLPKGTDGEKIKLGDHKSWFQKVVDDRGLMVMTWKDKKPVRLMSTFHSDNFIHVPDQSRRYKDKSATKRKPQVCVEYKAIMPGVDKMDQMMSAYDLTRKRMSRYYRRIYFTMLEMCYYNAFVVYNQLCEADQKLNYLEFKLRVVEDSIRTYGHQQVEIPDDVIIPMENFTALCSMKSQGSDYQKDPVERLQLGWHFPVKTETGKNGKHLSKTCIYCRSQTVKMYKNSVPPRTSWLCCLCKVPLCVECFFPFHTIPDYQNYNKHNQQIISGSGNNEETDEM